MSRKKNEALTELEVEARDRAKYLLERANAMKMEQEDEIKRLNEVGSDSGVWLKKNPLLTD